MSILCYFTTLIVLCRALESTERPPQYTESIAATEAISEFATAVAAEFRRRMRRTLDALREGTSGTSDKQDEKENKPPTEDE